MTTQDVTSILQTAIQALGLISIVLLIIQIRKTDKWNKLTQTIQTAQPTTFSTLSDAVCKLEDDGYLDLNKDIDEILAKKLIENKTCCRPITSFLNHLEEIAAANNLGAYNDDFAYVLWSSPIIKYYNLFKCFIEEYRNQTGDNELFVELEKLSLHWEVKYNHEIEYSKQKIARLENELRASRGVKKQY